MTLEKAFELLRLAEADWTEALDDHTYAEPNAEYAERLRHFAEAADRQRQALEYAANERLGWKPVPPQPGGRPAPYELSPESPRPGPPALWARFDRAYMAWDRSLEGTSIPEISRGFAEMSVVARELADAVDAERVAQPKRPPRSRRESA